MVRFGISDLSVLFVDAHQIEVFILSINSKLAFLICDVIRADVRYILTFIGLCVFISTDYKVMYVIYLNYYDIPFNLQVVN